MNFTDTQLQACFERNFAEATGVSDEQRQVGALIATHDWFRMTEGPHSPRVHETIDHLLALALRPGLHRWYRRSGANGETAAFQLREQLAVLAGERFGSTAEMPLNPSRA